MGKVYDELEMRYLTRGEEFILKYRKGPYVSRLECGSMPLSFLYFNDKEIAGYLLLMYGRGKAIEIVRLDYLNSIQHLKWKDVILNLESCNEDSTTLVCRCKECGEIFYIKEEEAMYFSRVQLPLPKRCRVCRRERLDKGISKPVRIAFIEEPTNHILHVLQVKNLKTHKITIYLKTDIEIKETCKLNPRIESWVYTQIKYDNSEVSELVDMVKSNINNNISSSVYSCVKVVELGVSNINLVNILQYFNSYVEAM